MPVTAIYSKNDGVVAWRACFDPNPANVVEYVEVDTGHAEMGFSADVYRILASELARASNQSRGRER